MFKIKHLRKKEEFLVVIKQSSVEWRFADSSSFLADELSKSE